MSRPKTPSVFVDTVDEKDLDALRTLYGSKVSVDQIDKVVHELTHHKYLMPCRHDIDEMLNPCRGYSPDATDRFEMAYYNLVQARSELDSAKDRGAKVKFSLKYAK